VAGQILGGRYQLIERPVAEGGMGQVWRARDLTLDRTVAVKTLRPDLVDDAGFDARFRAEARTLAALTHPNVVGIYDYGRCEVDGRPVAYLVMSFVEGQPLSRRLSDGPLPVAETMSIVAQAAMALHAAHRLGIVHRDVKPANILVQPDGKVVLVDFGVARSPASTSVHTGKVIFGSAHYMAPEQAAARGVSPATDVYALGVVAYHCLVGQPPFEAESALEVALKHVIDEPPPLPLTIPLAARRVVMRAMAKHPRSRYPSASELAAAATATAHLASMPKAAAGLALLGEPSDLTDAHLADAHLADAHLADAHLADADLADADLADADLANTAPLGPARRHRRALVGAGLAGVLLAGCGLAIALHPNPSANAGEPGMVHGGTATHTSAPRAPSNQPPVSGKPAGSNRGARAPLPTVRPTPVMTPAAEVLPDPPSPTPGETAGSDPTTDAPTPEPTTGSPTPPADDPTNPPS
jgi:eukaryotic-like serine/threonine-protein kinase